MSTPGNTPEDVAARYFTNGLMRDALTRDIAAKIEEAAVVVDLEIATHAAILAEADNFAKKHGLKGSGTAPLHWRHEHERLKRIAKAIRELK